MKWLRRFAWALGAGGVVLFLVLATEIGTRLSSGIVISLVPGQLSIGSITGRWLGPLQLRDIRYSNSEYLITLDSLALDWTPTALSQGTTQVDYVRAQGLSVKELAPSAEPPQAPPALRWPGKLILSTVTLTQATYQPAKGKQWPALQQAQLSASWHERALNIHQGMVVLPQGTLHVQGTLETGGRYPHQLQGQWQGHLPGLAPMRGEATLTGDLDDTTLTHTLIVPTPAHLTLRITHLLTQPRWQSSLRAAPFNLAVIYPDAPPAIVGGQISARDEGAGIHATGAVTLRREQHTLNTHWQIHQAQEDWIIDQLQLNLARHPTRLTVEGRVSPNAGWQADLTGRWRDLILPLDATHQVSAPRGEFNYRGTLERYRYSVRTALTITAPPNTPLARLVEGGHTLTATGRGTRENTHLDDVELTALDGVLHANGDIHWKDSAKNGVRWQMTLAASQINSARLAAEWPGRIDFTAQADGAWQAGKLTQTLAIPPLNGTLRDLPLQATARLSHTQSEVQFDYLVADLAGTRATATGQLSAVGWDASVIAESADLATILPHTSGQATATVTLLGPPTTPRAIAHIRADDLRVYDTHVRHVDITSDIDFQPNQAGRAQVTLNGVRHGALTDIDVEATLQGLTSAHTLSVNARYADTRATALLQGAVTGELPNLTWQGQLAQLALDEPLTGHWQLETPSALRMNRQEFKLQPACVRNQESAVCLDSAGSADQGGELNARVTQIPLRWLPTTAYDMALQGDWNGDLRLKWAADATLTGHAKVRTSDGMVRYNLTGEQPLALSYELGEISAELTREQLITRASIKLNEADNLRARFTVARAALPAPVGTGLGSGVLDGELDGQIHDLSLLPDLVPELANVSGVVRARLRVGGTWAAPRYRGEALLEQGNTALPRLGIQLKDIAVKLQGDDSGSLALTGQARAGKGTLTLAGKIQPALQQPGWALSLQLQGTQIETLNTADVRAITSPDLTLTAVGNKISIQGKLDLEETRLQAGAFRNALHPSEDILIEAQHAQTAARRWEVNTLVAVNLGERVYFEGFGLNGRIGGNIVLVSVPGKLTTALGELRVEKGTYTAYGQELDIAHGRLSFVGGQVSNPGIDARAIRVVDTVTAGVDVRGTLQEPQLTIFSEPTMDEADALAYLLFGHPLRDSSPEQGKELQYAARQVGLAGGELLAKQIGKTLGVEEIRLQSSGSNAEDPALLIGTYLSPRLYISYGVTLVERINTFKLRYTLSKRWTLEAEQGLESGADLLFSLERD